MDDLKNSFNDIFSVPNKLENTEDPLSLLKTNNESTPVIKNNYTEQRSKIYKKAKKTIDSILDFYFKENVISEDDYIRQKAEQDQATLGDLMNQIEISNRAISTLMDNIDMGDIAPRMFEVLATAQNTFIELLKMKSMHFLQMEESTKRLIVDRQIYQSESIKDKNESNDNITTRGSKKLMQQIQDAIKNDEIDEANIND